MHIDKFYSFYKEAIKDTRYVLQSEADFVRMVSNQKYLIETENDSIKGLLIYSDDNEKGIYIQMILGKIEYQKTLLKKLIENTSQTIWVHFFHKFGVPWYVDDKHIHPNYQGELIGSPLHKAYLDFGFSEHSIEDTYFINLYQFELKSSLKSNLDAIKSSGYEVTIYDDKKHYGLKEFAEGLGSRGFSEAILNNIKRETPYPIVTALYQGKAIGFAGPMHLASDKRGIFYGIELNQEHRGLGLGKALFQILCDSLKNMGAEYMTLFTGRTNPARNIYMDAGFKIMHSFSTLKLVR
ncbi:GNAT family N-acetyltransferase [Acholeplasma equirhinis]|uniref:GNAT family N-acetyltransferase n=1 Tax=Acholeplasma equirhinis TaxID=555393 RepID=UPI00197AF71A|nr:GNAT family N-acetyltransferase [Acholeplasma equirhinis]MBN3489938.1 GNAT family N-acetyltransferase [Acholeplasma equirhinis]